LGVGGWGLGPIPHPQSPIPSPQSPKSKYFYINEILKNINSFAYFIVTS